MAIKNTILQGAIKSFATVLGEKGLFDKVLAEIKVINDTHPSSTGAEKRHILMESAGVIFNDVGKPVLESTLRLILELAVKYIQLSLL